MLIWNRPSSRTRALLSLTIIFAMTASFSVSPSSASGRATPPSQGEAPSAIGATAETPRATTATSEPSAEARARAQEAYARIDMSFEENRGQTDDEVKFLARGGGYTLFLTGTEAVFVLARRSDAQTEERRRAQLMSGDAASSAPDVEPSEPPAILRMKLDGANPRPAVSGLNQLAGKVNYFIGNDPEKWHTEIPTFGRVRYDDVYQGVGMVYYGNQRQLEYDFVVAPGADYRQVALKFEGASGMELETGTGDLLLRVGDETIRQQRPVVYQEVNGERQEIESGYALRGAGRVEFSVGHYDASKPLIIDPVLAYSTYLGGSGDENGRGIVVDAAGNAYVTGRTSSTNFPTGNAPQATYGGATDAFVTKLNASGSALVYSTYLGGSGGDNSSGIVVDATGNAYVAGFTNSPNFPTANAIQATYGGGVNDTFVTKLNASGSALVYSTYLGGTDSDKGNGIAVDSSANAYVIGQTGSTNFPTANAFQATYGGGDFDGFVTKLNASGSALVYSTYLGGGNTDDGFAIAVDSSGNAYLTGDTSSTNFPKANALQATYGGGDSDAFVTKLNASGAALVYSTYLGGGGLEAGLDIALDSSANAYVTGSTGSTNFPIADAFQATNGGGGKIDAFMTKIGASGAALVYSTYLGGSSDDIGAGIAVDASGNAYVIGRTNSANFPTANAFQATYGGGGDLGDAFVTKIDASGAALVYSTYLGGSSDDVGNGIAVDTARNTYVTGLSTSTDFPTAGAIQGTKSGFSDAIIAKLGDYAIAGRVLDASNSGISGVTVTLNGTNSAIATTDSTGYFGFLHTSSGGNYIVTPFKTNYNFTPSSITVNNLNNNQDLIFIGTSTAPTPGPAHVQFEFDTYIAPEDCNSLDVTVIRTGDTSGALTVDYATSDGTAKQKGDYEINLGTLAFAPGDTRKTITLLISEDAFNEGDENFSVNLFNLVGAATLDQASRATIVIADDDPSGTTTNPIDDTQTFVSQHYHDFLNRQPDPSGLLFWINNIDSCGGNAQCREARRIDTSAAFFLSIEYQQTGFYAIRLQRAAFGKRSDTATTRMTYQDLTRDTRQLGDGVIVGQPGADAKLEQNKQAYATQVVNNAAFISRFPSSQTAAQYVDALYASAQVTPTATERSDAVTAFGGGGTAGRVAALRKVSDSPSLSNAEFSPAFVLLQFHGYLRRNPTDLPDTTDSGYQFWLGKLNSFGGDFRKADMVKAFLSSSEYRLRFGPS
jgi:hypothetical protein